MNGGSIPDGRRDPRTPHPASRSAVHACRATDRRHPANPGARCRRGSIALPYNTEKGGADAAQLPRRDPARHGALHGGRALGGDHPRAARLSAARHEPRVDRSARSRDLRLPRPARLGIGGAIARPGLHGRKPVFRRLRDLALSYVDPYVDLTGGVRGYGVADLRTLMGRYDWRLSPQQRVGGRAGADRPAASRHQDRPRPDRAAAREVSRLPRRARRPQADLLRSLALDADPGWLRVTRRAPAAVADERWPPPASLSPSRSRASARVIGSSRAWRSASSKRCDRASPRVRSCSTESWKSASRRAVSARRMPWASSRFGLSPRSGSTCDDHALEVGVDDQRRVAAGTLDGQLGLQARHAHPTSGGPPAVARRAPARARSTRHRRWT